jgi:hypothetical protein
MRQQTPLIGSNTSGVESLQPLVITPLRLAAIDLE